MEIRYTSGPGRLGDVRAQLDTRDRMAATLEMAVRSYKGGEWRLLPDDAHGSWHALFPAGDLGRVEQGYGTSDDDPPAAVA